MTASTYLMAANAAVWIGVAGYVLYLASRQRRLERRLRQLEVSNVGR